MKRIGRRRFVIFAGVLMITAGTLLGGSFTAAASPEYLRQQDHIAVAVPPNAAQASVQLTEDEIADIAEALEAPVAWWGDMAGAIQTDRRSTPADVLAVGGPFSDFHPLRMLSGSFLPRTGGVDDAIVLDKDLAWQLFGAVDAVGMEVEFNDKTYTVTGVCDTDETLLGLLSASGTGRAYIEYSSPEGIVIAGMETALPRSVPGQSLDAVKSTLAAQGKPASGFLIQDYTERALLDAESAGIPMAVLAGLLTIMLVLIVKRVIAGMARSLRDDMLEAYFRDSWHSVLRRLAEMLLICAAAAGVIYAIWLLTGFPFYLPARFIPDSWVNIGFYKSLIQSEAQTAIAARAFAAQQWDILREAGMWLSGFMNMVSVAGLAVFGAGLCLLRDARKMDADMRTGWRSEAMDIPAVWAYFAASLGAGFLLCAAAGLQVFLPTGTTIVLYFGLSFWAAQTLYGERIEKHIFRAVQPKKPIAFQKLRILITALTKGQKQSAESFKINKYYKEVEK